MGPNPPMYAGRELARAAEQLGYHPYPFPMAVNSRTHDGRPACNSCGFCSGFGCPIHARGEAAISFLHEAIRAGAELRTRCFVHRVDVDPAGRRARGVSYLDEGGRAHTVRADVVVLAPSAVETARLLLLSRGPGHPHGLGNRSGLVGRNLMFHYFSVGAAVFAERAHPWRGPASTFTLDDFVGPVTGAPARAAGLPYFKGGNCEVGGGTLLLEEANLYAAAGYRGTTLTSLLRTLAVREHFSGIQLNGEDMPQHANRVDLDPRIRDFRGVPVPRITHSQHRFELAASSYFAPRVQAICATAAPTPDTAVIGERAGGWRRRRSVRDAPHHGNRPHGRRSAPVGRRPLRAPARGPERPPRRCVRVRLLRRVQPDAHADGAGAAVGPQCRPVSGGPVRPPPPPWRGGDASSCRDRPTRARR